jgi:hypothetical protein
MRPLALLLVLLGGSAALAHDVPVNPSTCTFDPVELTASGAGPSANVAAPTAADGMRVVYSVASGIAQFQQPNVSPRAFTIAGVAGTIAFPRAWNAQLVTSGDLHAEDVAFGITLGGVRTTVPVNLTSAVEVVGDVVAAGAPMGSDGSFTLAGVIPAGHLAAPLDAAATVVRVTCRVTPVPDRDQFIVAPAMTSLAGVLSDTRAKLRGALQGGTLSAATFTGGPAILRLDAGGASLATVEFPGGFAAQGRDLVAQGSDGSRLTLRLGKGRAPARLLATLPGVTVPAGTTGSIDVEATLVAGPMTARGSRPFRARGGTLRAGS